MVDGSRQSPIPALAIDCRQGCGGNPHDACDDECFGNTDTQTTSLSSQVRQPVAACVLPDWPDRRTGHSRRPVRSSWPFTPSGKCWSRRLATWLRRGYRGLLPDCRLAPFSARRADAFLLTCRDRNAGLWAGDAEVQEDSPACCRESFSGTTEFNHRPTNRRSLVSIASSPVVLTPVPF